MLSFSKLKILIYTHYDFMNIPKYNKLVWKTIEDPELIETLLIFRKK